MAAKYLKIADVLRQDILSGKYSPGERLPAQRELARGWNTTMSTTRRVLETLSDAGLLRVEHGVGTYVADLGREQDMLRLSSFDEELAAKDFVVRTELVSKDSGVGYGGAAKALALPANLELIALARVRLVDGAPLVYQRSYLSNAHASALDSYDPDVPLYAFLRDRLGLIATFYREFLSARPIPPEPADHLCLEPGALALFSRKISYADDGAPFLYDEAFMPSERIEMVVHRSGDRFAVEYLPTASARVLKDGDVVA